MKKSSINNEKNKKNNNLKNIFDLNQLLNFILEQILLNSSCEIPI